MGGSGTILEVVSQAHSTLLSVFQMTLKTTAVSRANYYDYKLIQVSGISLSTSVSHTFEIKCLVQFHTPRTKYVNAIQVDLRWWIWSENDRS